MDPSVSSHPHQRRAYDHRLREVVCRTGGHALTTRLRIPRLTVASWKQRGLRHVVSAEALSDGREQLLETIGRLERRARILAAALRVVLALLRVSGFRLAGQRLPEGVAKGTLLRAIATAEPALPLALILRIVGLPASRYHAWRRAGKGCGLDDRSSCPRTTPGSLTASEVAIIKDMALDPEHRHMPLRTLSLYAQRLGKVFASVTTWARLIRAVVGAAHAPAGTQRSPRLGCVRRVRMSTGMSTPRS